MKKNFGIAFVTGRRQFQDVLKTYFENWIEHDLINNRKINLHLFVVYDVNYSDAVSEDFRNIPPEITGLLESVHFYGRREIEDEGRRLVAEGTLNQAEYELLFGEGYAKKRNVALHFAVKHKMDRLLFLDDDEYPVAVTRGAGNLSWMGQSIVRSHLQFGEDADITHGRHCGYISPIPHVAFDDNLTENDFRRFVEAISNDIISWEKVKETTIENHGVTLADPEILDKQTVSTVEEVNGMKFISAANLCFNLERLKKLPVFYNPPGARGEDAFMSTMLTEQKVLRIPCYTFHDAFAEYQHLLQGVLPQELKAVDSTSPAVVGRFVKASIGWMRYKPLLTYVTQPDLYDSIIDESMRKLDRSVPKLCKHFGTSEFEVVAREFRRYHSNVRTHFGEFVATKRAWSKVIETGAAPQQASV